MKSSGKKLWYQLPGTAKLVAITPRCGVNATKITTANGNNTINPRKPFASTVVETVAALLCIA